tara:strand:+ start:677 stop:844 length:168 start_codon:yes stop_codon:yes gene_type:complete
MAARPTLNARGDCDVEKKSRDRRLLRVVVRARRTALLASPSPQASARAQPKRGKA